MLLFFSQWQWENICKIRLIDYNERILKIEKMTKIHPGMTEIQVKTHGHSNSKWKNDSAYRRYGALFHFELEWLCVLACISVIPGRILVIFFNFEDPFIVLYKSYFTNIFSLSLWKKTTAVHWLDLWCSYKIVKITSSNQWTAVVFFTMTVRKYL